MPLARALSLIHPGANMHRIPRFSLFVALLATGGAVCADSFARTAACASKNIVRQYFADGSLASEAEFNSKGEVHGRYREWHETGVLRTEREYLHGQWVSKRSYSSSGNVISEVSEGADFLPITKVHAD
jgi:hypothetical protein